MGMLIKIVVVVVVVPWIVFRYPGSCSARPCFGSISSEVEPFKLPKLEDNNC